MAHSDYCKAGVPGLLGVFSFFLSGPVRALGIITSLASGSPYTVRGAHRTQGCFCRPFPVLLSEEREPRLEIPLEDPLHPTQGSPPILLAPLSQAILHKIPILSHLGK